MTKGTPRGIRNANPGNIEWGSPWQGLRPVEERTDSRFAQFTSPAFGIRALAIVLITYQDKRRARDGSKIDTIREIIDRWAPAFENDTNSYVRAVANAVCNGAKGCTGPDDPTVDVHDYATAKALVEAIIKHENGPGPLKTANTWYSNGQIDEGLRLAGIVRDRKGKIEATKETVGASVTAVVGGAQIAEVAPAIAQAMTQADSHLSSGSIVRIVLGVATVALAAYIAYVQIQRQKVAG